MLKEIEENIDSTKIYIGALFVCFVLWIVSMFVDGEWLKQIIFNPFWPILILLSDKYFSHNKQKISDKNEKRIERITASLVVKSEAGEEVISIAALVILLDNAELLQVIKDNLVKKNLEKALGEEGDPIVDAGTDNVIPE